MHEALVKSFPPIKMLHLHLESNPILLLGKKKPYQKDQFTTHISKKLIPIFQYNDNIQFSKSLFKPLFQYWF
jgi:hypothetical protein